MIWVELRNNDTIYNEGWRFSECVWAPIKKKNGATWPFWYLIETISVGDVIFHLRNLGGKKFFTGYSFASTRGYISSDIPSESAHEWDYSKKFFRADLTDYKIFDTPISLLSFFSIHSNFLRQYFLENKNKLHDKKSLFYVIQSNRLQCLNGAYFSEFEAELAKLIISDLEKNLNKEEIVIKGRSKVGENIRQIKTRIGQQEFSLNVKNNFENKCCYPGCKIEGPHFIVGAHIARWADSESLRGEVGNGLSFCLIHDKAFEYGYFTINDHFKIVLLREKIGNRNWLLHFLQGGENLEIKKRHFEILITALSEHRKRINS